MQYKSSNDIQEWDNKDERLSCGLCFMLDLKGKFLYRLSREDRGAIASSLDRYQNLNGFVLKI